MDEGREESLLKFGLVGDSGIKHLNSEPLRKSLKRLNATRLIIPGDNLYDLSESYASIWDPWKKEGFDFSVVALGNHTLSYTVEMDYFGMPNEYFARAVGSALFLILNSDNEANAHEQASWLRTQLQATRAPFVFVVFHHPPFTVTDFHPWREKEAFHLAVRPVLLEFGSKISSLIVGHDHVTGLFEMNGIKVIVAGAGTQTRPTEIVDPQIDDAVVTRIALFHDRATWARLDVDPSLKEARLHFVDLQKEQVVSTVLLTEDPSRRTEKSKPLLER